MRRDVKVECRFDELDLQQAQAVSGRIDSVDAGVQRRLAARRAPHGAEHVSGECALGGSRLDGHRILAVDAAPEAPAGGEDRALGDRVREVAADDVERLLVAFRELLDLGLDHRDITARDDPRREGDRRGIRCIEQSGVAGAGGDRRLHDDPLVRIDGGARGVRRRRVGRGNDTDAGALEVAQVRFVEVPAHRRRGVDDACRALGSVEPGRELRGTLGIVPRRPDHQQIEGRRVDRRIVPHDRRGIGAAGGEGRKQQRGVVVGVFRRIDVGHDDADARCAGGGHGHPA